MVENHELNLHLLKHFIEDVINALIVIEKLFLDLLQVFISVENVAQSLLGKPIRFEVNYVLSLF